MKRVVALGGLALALGIGGSAAAAEDPKPQNPPSSSSTANPAPAAGAPASIDFEALLSQARPGSGGSSPANPNGRFRDFNEVTRGAEKIDGLFTLHKKDDHLYAEIKMMQFDQPMLVPITIARGLTQAGVPLTSDDEWVIVFHKAGDRVQVIRRNIHYKAPAGTPLEKALKQNYTDSIILSVPIVAMNMMGGMSTVIDLSDILFTDFAEMGLGFLDRNRSGYHKVKGFPNNLEIEVEATFSGRGGMNVNDGIADHRGVTVVIHYSFVKLPDPFYRTRPADDRVGHFLSATRDYGSNNPDDNFVRMVNRWRIEKADPRAKLSAPRKQIIWYIEDNVPNEYRPFVEAGILEWNKAFEAIGFRNAIDVRWQTEGRDEFDPEDTNYCTFRWITTPRTFAMSCLRANPITGEMIDGDVIFDGSWVKAWKHDYGLLTGVATPTSLDAGPIEPLAIGEILSPILAAKRGFGLPTPLYEDRFKALEGKGLAVVPSGWTPIQAHLAKRAGRSGEMCQFALGMQSEMTLAAVALAEPGKIDGKLPDELIGQAIKEVVMHEVGHSLGLRHNFKASTMLTAEQLHDTAITSKKGLTGSVMDYAPMNLAPKGAKQGDYFSTTIGPYDYWAIEYAYKQLDGAEEIELKKIASRAPEPDLTYGTDGDSFVNDDPLVNRYDLGSDVCRFAKDRIVLASSLLKDIDQKVVKDGDSWANSRTAFSALLQQYGNAAHLAANYIGGQYVVRDHKGDKGARDPVIPVAGAKQREALKFLVENILGDQAFQFSPALLRKLGAEKWNHWGDSSEMRNVHLNLLDRVLGIQRIMLSQCLSTGTLNRLQEQELLADPSTDPLKMAEVFRALTDGIWSELNAPAADAKDKNKKLSVSTVRRNLQREYLRRLNTMVLGDARGPLPDIFAFLSFGGGGSYPADARALARLHMKEISERIGKSLDDRDLKIDDTTRAHLEETRQRIAKVLEAKIDANEA
jgi:Met-zincin/Domain of unknown function (DUF5117)/Domain of unknown function (DUF5118)